MFIQIARKPCYKQLFNFRGIMELMEKIYSQEIQSPLGKIHLLATDEKLISVLFDKNFGRIKYKNIIIKENHVLAKTKKQLSEYFTGTRFDFDLPYHFDGSDFQKKVWQSLTQIPYGKTISYQEQGELIQNQKAVRAIGRTNGQNQFCIIVPCHRVIGKDGSLKGYAGGIKIKEALLNFEKQNKQCLL